MKDGQERAAAAAWVAWADDYRRSIDPLQQSLRLPPDPQPTPEALRPHMPGWTPYGPER